MGALPPALDQDATHAVLSAALHAIHGAEARLEEWTADVTFTQHGRRRVVRYDLRAYVPGGHDVQRYQWVGKFYDRDDDARRVAAVLRALARSDCGSRGDLAVPGVLAYDAARRLLLLTYEPGEAVSFAIGREPPTILAAMGRALAALHATPVTVDTTRSPAAVLEDLRPQIDDLRARLPGETGFLQHRLAQLERDTPLLPAKRSFVHGDFGPANLLWSTGRLVVLDFDKCCQGDPALDLGNLLAQLRRMSVRKPDRLRDFVQARASLLSAYRRWSAADPGLDQRVAWYEGATLLRKVHRLALTATRDEATRLLRACDGHAA